MTTPTGSLLPDSLVYGRYRVVRQIGRGGMGAVYEAKDTRLGSIVALKETLVRGEQLDEAFAREARLLSSLRHPALPVVSDYFAEGEGHFLVMQFIPGTDLGALITQRSAPFSFQEVLPWLDKLLDALDYLHTQQPPIVHRDIKPQNLKLTPRGEIVLLDFGLAKGGSTGLDVTKGPGLSLFGYTPHYAPLEQIQGTGTDPRSDLYSLAATVYALLSNTVPPNALERAAALLRAKPDPLPPLVQFNPQVPLAVSELLHRCLALNIEDRPASAAEVRAQLATDVRTGSAGAPTADMTVVHVPELRMPPLATPQATQGLPTQGLPQQGQSTLPLPVSSRRPWWVALLVLAGLALAAGGIWLFGRPGFDQSDPAATQTAVIAAIQETSRAEGQAGILTVLHATETAAAQATSFAAEIATAEGRGEQRVIQTAEAAGTETAVANAAAAAPTAEPSATSQPPTTEPSATSEPPTVTPPPTAAPVPTSASPAQTVAPSRTPAPSRPSATPAPTSTPQLARSDIDGGNGTLFAVSGVDGPTIDTSLVSTGGSCFQGTVRSAGGQLYTSFFVQASNGATTVEARSFPDSGNYRVCGLSAGRWGIAIYAINGVSLGGETAAHQARVSLSGTPGEVYYINFRAKSDPPTPTAAPTDTPVPTPFSLYTGTWRAVLRLPSFEGTLAFDITEGRIYSLGVNSGYCVWLHNQNLSIDVTSGSFSYDGPSNPTGNIGSYSIRGSFSGNQATGTLSATDAGGSVCLSNVQWTATRQ